MYRQFRCERPSKLSCWCRKTAHNVFEPLLGNEVVCCLPQFELCRSYTTYDKNSWRRSKRNNKIIRDMFGRRPIATNHHLLDQLRLKNLLLTVKQSVWDQFNYLEIISTIDHGYFYTSSDEITFNYCLIVKCCWGLRICIFSTQGAHKVLENWIVTDAR